jgi:hypothetical protein
MKKIVVPLLFALFTKISVMAQVTVINIDPNVMERNNDGKDLVKYIFPEDDNRNILFSGIVNCGISADTIMGLAKDYVYDLEKQNHAKCKMEFESKTKIGYHIELPIGKEFYIINWPGSHSLQENELSKISFDLSIEPRQGKYRYVLSNFITERYRIHGAGISEGQSNFVHWQRVYSLTKEMPRRGKKRKEYEMMIEKEKAIYQAEYDAVQKVVADLESLTDDNF